MKQPETFFHVTPVWRTLLPRKLATGTQLHWVPRSGERTQTSMLSTSARVFKCTPHGEQSPRRDDTITQLPNRVLMRGPGFIPSDALTLLSSAPPSTHRGQSAGVGIPRCRARPQPSLLLRPEDKAKNKHPSSLTARDLHRASDALPPHRLDSFTPRVRTAGGGSVLRARRQGKTKRGAK